MTKLSTLLLLIAACGRLFAQSSTCAPRPEVQEVLAGKLSFEALDQLKFADRVAFRRTTLEDLIARYPREVEPQRRLLADTFEDDIDRMPELIARYRKQAEQHPDDPLALYLAGVALYRRDTDRSIRLLEQARTLAPNFPWPALQLARIYSPGTKRADQAKAQSALAAFFSVCPSSTDPEAQTRLGKFGTSDLQARVATALRARLANETNLIRLKNYSILWSLEFRTHPPADHAAVRRQITEDLAKLEKLNPNPKAAWLVFLKDGYKQSGASAEVLMAQEDLVIQTFPHSDQAYQIVSERWKHAHPEPENQQDAIAWAAYHKAYRTALKEWMPRFTESRDLQHEAWFWEYLDELDAPPDLALRALDDYLANAAPYQSPLNSIEMAASFLVVHKLQPRRVFDLLREHSKLMDQWEANKLVDNLSAEAQDILASNAIIMRQQAAGNILVAARLAEQPSAAQPVAAFVERDVPADAWPNIQTHYWQNRARLAALEGKKADALLFYQKALQTRKQPPQPLEGQLFDDLTDEAQTLWKTLGGTETAFTLWIKPPTPAIQSAEEMSWKKPAKDMPPFEIPDLTGKTWRLKELSGRTVLIAVWATWCGPCRAELPLLEKLYEKVKDRKDLQILTLSIDEDPGVIAPFMHEHSFTFPVLPAQTFVTSLLDIVTIPQNWILDPKGAWRWTGGIAPSQPDWQDATLKQLESAQR